ncbi:AAA family ATPase [Actinoallomurus iriomotensis]|uniref:Septum formation initiator n=1 Tax=Actinoallomurus iriomotensis TaxID=478107 RepID=A0A9W6S3Y6_9ACTN|nr:AAA family ATPase [Actinoallomurus iriomotensis]GLY85317.1 septum formation initiator [Actinoallomurus iriomotensis]
MIRVHVVLTTTDEALAAWLRAWGDEPSDIALVAVEPDSSGLLAAVGDGSGIDVVLIDEGIGSLPSHELARRIVARHPHLAVVLIADDVDTGVLGRAIEAGARGVLGRHSGSEEFRARITGAAEWSRDIRRRLGIARDEPSPARQGTLVTVAAGKGGTGATTLCVLTALTLGGQSSVCLVDLDLQTGDIPSYLDLTHRRSIVDLVEVADDITPTLLADAVYVHPDGPHVLLAPAEGEYGEDVTADVVRRVLEALRARYDIVIADCGASMTEANVTAVEMADRVVVTATPDLPGLRGAKRLARLWSRLQVRKDDDLAVVLVRHSRRSEIQPEFAAKILGLPLLGTRIPAAFWALEPAVNNGTGLRVDDPSLGRAVRNLVTELGLVATDDAGPATAERGSRRGRRPGRDGR